MELNQHKMGLRPHGATWEWYSLQIVCFIHVHNNTPNGRWTYKIRTSCELESQNTYDDKADAEAAAKKQMRLIINKALLALE